MQVLVTGATGFVGRYLRVALDAAGISVRLGTRDPARRRDEEPDEPWVHFNTRDPNSMRRALEGCDAAYFLVHEVGARDDYATAELRAAEAFAAATGDAGVGRTIYLGGVAPDSTRSRHLQSRRKTGEILRNGRTPCIELRAAMIIGEGSASWKMVTDLAGRLPAMLLPRWLLNHSWPIGIDDVVDALLASLALPFVEKPSGVQATDPPGINRGSRCFGLPGPVRINHRDLLLTVAERLGHHPVMVGVPILSPRLSSYWIGLVTSVRVSLARELVEGLATDLDPTRMVLWDRLDRGPTDLPETMARALADAGAGTYPTPAARKRLIEIGNIARQSWRHPQ